MRRKKHSHFVAVRKRPFLLLEVLIAFVLIVMCMLPLITPHTAILKSQRQFVDRIELDHVVNLLFADIYASLYRNEIPWESVISSNAIPIEEMQLQRAGWNRPFPYKGTYQFTIERYKPKKEAPYTLYLIGLTFTFEPRTGDLKTKKSEYHYQLFIERNLETQASPQQQNTPQDTNEKPAPKS